MIMRGLTKWGYLRCLGVGSSEDRFKGTEDRLQFSDIGIQQIYYHEHIYLKYTF